MVSWILCYITNTVVPLLKYLTCVKLNAVHGQNSIYSGYILNDKLVFSFKKNSSMGFKLYLLVTQDTT